MTDTFITDNDYDTGHTHADGFFLSFTCNLCGYFCTSARMTPYNTNHGEMKICDDCIAEMSSLGDTSPQPSDT